MVRVAGDLIQRIGGNVGVLWLLLAIRTKRTVARSGGTGRLAVTVIVFGIKMRLEE